MDKLGIFYLEELDRLEDKVKSRVKELTEAARSLEKWAKKHISNDISFKLSLERLDTAVKSYALDIIRYKHFHGMLDEEKKANINFQKIYAFTIQWILREKPLYVVCTGLKDKFENDNKNAVNIIEFSNYVNEIWAFSWMNISYYALTNEPLDVEKHSDKNNVHSSVRDDWLYLMKYRDFSVASFEIFLDSIFNHDLIKNLELDNKI